MASRRHFFQSLAVLAAASKNKPSFAKDNKGKRILILGGTRFLGPALVDAALAQGVSLTLFNRGKSNPSLFSGRSEIVQLQGDRTGDLSALRQKTWDAVIDTSGYFPRLVSKSAEALKGSVSQYVFISSVSVYKMERQQGPISETTPVQRLVDPTVEKIDETTYGGLKALCEEAAEKVFPGRTLNIRPGFIVGPKDGSDRFTYYPLRVLRGGTMLAPGSPDDPVQLIDVRDLAEWIIAMVLLGENGVYNAVGPKKTLTMGTLLAEVMTAVGKKVNLQWVPGAFLDKNKVELPPWVSQDGPDGGLAKVDGKKAVTKGLRFRPLGVTTKDTLSYFMALPKERQEQLRAGITAAKEAELLASYASQKSPNPKAAKQP